MDDELAASLHTTPPAELVRLSRSTKNRIRVAVAGNTAAPPAVLELLASDFDADVRTAVAQNELTLPQTVTRLALDDDADVAKTARANLAQNPDHVSTLAASSNEKHRWLAAQVSGSLRDLLKLAQDSVVQIRQSLAQRADIPWSILLILFSDENDVIKSTARQNIVTQVSELKQASGTSFDKIWVGLATLDAIVSRERRDAEVARQPPEEDNNTQGILGAFLQVEGTAPSSPTMNDEATPSSALSDNPLSDISASHVAAVFEYWHEQLRATEGEWTAGRSHFLDIARNFGISSPAAHVSDSDEQRRDEYRLFEKAVRQHRTDRHILDVGDPSHLDRLLQFYQLELVDERCAELFLVKARAARERTAAMLYDELFSINRRVRAMSEDDFALAARWQFLTAALLRENI